MVTFKDIWDRLMLDTGQYLYESALKIDSTDNRFNLLVRGVLGTYSKYMPVEKNFNRTIDLSYDFTNDSEGIPDWISSAVLVSYPLYQFVSNNDLNLINVFHEYRKPVLYVSIAGEYEITALYNHEVIDDNGVWKIDTISDSDDLFFKLLAGRFLQLIGRSRRAFTLNDLPISSDADSLVSEGKEMEQEALEQLGEESKWYLCWK